MKYQGIAYNARVWPRLFWGVVLLATARINYKTSHPPSIAVTLLLICAALYFFTTAARVAWRKRSILWP